MRHLQVSPQLLAAHLFLQEAERMPVDAPDEWFEPRSGETAGYLDRVTQFLEAMDEVLDRIQDLPQGTPDEDIQFHFYEAGKSVYGEDRRALREFFRLTYLFLLNSFSGPRLGQFVAIQGIPEFVAMVHDRLTNPLLTPLENL